MNRLTRRVIELGSRGAKISPSAGKINALFKIVPGFRFCVSCLNCWRMCNVAGTIGMVRTLFAVFGVLTVTPPLGL